MTQAFRFIGGEQIRGAFSVDVDTFDGAQINDTIKFPRGFLNSATAGQLADLGIEAYDIPPPPPYVPPVPGSNEFALQNALEPWQFFAMLEILGKREAIEAVIASIPDGAQRIVAAARYQHANQFNRDNPLFAQIAPAVGLTDAALDAAWAQAVAMAGGEGGE